MEDLYIKMENEKVLISQGQVAKYNLKAGSISPYNRYHIVDKNGNENIHTEKKIGLKDHPLDEMMSDGIIFTPSETLDISRGADTL